MPDRFRPVFTELSDYQKETVLDIKAVAHQLELVMLYGYESKVVEQNSREMSIAMTRLEEAVMWAVKHWTSAENDKIW